MHNPYYRDINHRRFKAYLSLHEYEGMLFLKPPQIAIALKDRLENNSERMPAF